MRTVAERVRDTAGLIEADLAVLLRKHSSLRFWNRHLPGVVVVAAGDYTWAELDEPGRRLQAKLVERYRRFCDVVRVLLREQPPATLRELRQYEERVRRAVEQNGFSHKADIEVVLADAAQALSQQARLIGRLYHPGAEGEAVFVPDTNALLYNPQLESWRFAEAPTFMLVLTPTIVSELDELKVNHRVEDVRKKAETLIRVIKGYRARGSLADGVPLVTGVSRVMARAVEPTAEQSLPWLDFKNNDDRFIASAIEVMRTTPQAAVAIVTRDLNLQNKAEFADLPFVEPPDP